MTRYRLTLLALGVAAVSLFVPPIADAQDDYYALYNRFQYHHVGLSARSAGMGGVYSALSGGELGLLGNPASLGFSESPFLMLEGELEDVASDISVDAGFGPVAEEADTDIWSIGAGFSYPFEWGGLGIHYNHREDDHDSDVYDLGPFGVKRGGDLEREYISLGGGYRVNEQWAIGYRYSYIDWDQDIKWDAVRAAPGLAFPTVSEDFEGHKNHFGLQYRANEMITLGLDGYYGIGDLDSNITTGDIDSDSWAVRGGIAWELEEIPLLLALDLNFENRELDGRGADTDEDLFGLHLGAEYEVVENLFLRAGYQYEDIDFEDRPALIDESPSIGAYTAGIGYEYDRFTFDYGFIYTDTGSGDITHIFGIGIHF